jgi:hypothetical protein
MSNDEGFLARWSRRKRGAAAKAHGRPKPKKAREGAASEATAAALPPQETQPLLDPASLPPIESIGAGSDIRPFLVTGVPADLTRSALRRAWSADPAIRDFIGLSENSWDFNAAGGVPGFGSLTAEDARRLVARVMEETQALEPAPPVDKRSSDYQDPMPESESNRPAPGSVTEQMKLVGDIDTGHGNPMPRAGKSNIAGQHETVGRESRPSVPRRRHGGALPD